MKITTHILDISQGKPAAGVLVKLEVRASENQWQILGTAETNADGRTPDLTPPASNTEAGVYRLTFETNKYFSSKQITAFYPFVQIAFEIKNPAEHYHVPLLLSPYGYSTYRGS